MASRYSRIIEKIFLAKYKRGAQTVAFEREDISRAAKSLGIELPKNLGDLIYSFRFRADFPESISSKAPKGSSWIVRLAGKGKYCIVANPMAVIVPQAGLAVTKIPEATPAIIERYALSDEQALLAKLRYNRLIDVFTGVTCYALQSHLRTALQEMGQVETDEVYVGMDRRGAHYVFPVQAKGGSDRQSIVQIEQDFALCKEKFPDLICRPIAAQFMPDETIALFGFEEQEQRIVVSAERHYKLVPQDQLTKEEIRGYQARTLVDS